MAIRDRLSMPTREQLVMALLQAVARYWGVHPALLPERHYRVFAYAGIDPAALRQTLRRIRSMDDWPRVWRQEAHRHLGEGNKLAGFLCLYIGQRIMIDPGALKDELYAEAVELYLELEHDAGLMPVQLELAHTPTQGQSVALYVQEPRRQCLGTVLLVPGVTFTKEELHFAAETFLKRGWRVVRMDNPIYGQTTGTIKDLGTGYICEVAHELRSRWDGPVHGIGFSLGGLLLLKNARCFDRVVTIGAPCEPDRYLDKLPSHSRRALGHMVGATDYSELRELLTSNRLQSNELGDVPLLVVHGGKDKTVPATEMTCIAAKAQGTVWPLMYPHESHGCMGALEEIWAECLEWFAVDAQDRRPLQVVNVTPSLLRQGVDKGAAALAGAKSKAASWVMF